MSNTEQKEEHRIGTIGRWDPPAANWAAEYDWTRYRGPDPYPVPGDWTLRVVEADGVIWQRFPDVGTGLASDTDVYDELGPDGDVEAARGEEATLGRDVVNPNAPMEDWDHEEVLTVDGTQVFARVEPSRDELMANVATVLAMIDDESSPDGLSVTWSTGWERGENGDDDDHANASLAEYADSAPSRASRNGGDE